MKKEELIALGVDEEIAKKIMAINGADIENAKSKADKSQEIEKLQSELESKDKMLNEANSQIEKFNGMDIEGIKKEAESWKTKYSEFEANAKVEKEAFEKKLAEQQYDFRVKEYLGQHKFTNDFVKDAFEKTFKEQGFKLGEDGNFLGADDYIKGFQEKNPGVFAVEAPPSNEPQIQQFSAATSGGATPVKGMSVLEAMKAANAGQSVDLGQVGKFAVQQQ